MVGSWGLLLFCWFFLSFYKLNLDAIISTFRTTRLMMVTESLVRIRIQNTIKVQTDLYLLGKHPMLMDKSIYQYINISRSQFRKCKLLCIKILSQWPRHQDRNDLDIMMKTASHQVFGLSRLSRHQDSNLEIANWEKWRYIKINETTTTIMNLTLMWLLKIYHHRVFAAICGSQFILQQK